MEKIKVDSLFYADCIVTQNDGRDIVEKGGIAVADGKIIAIGSRADMMAQYEAKTVRELGKAAIVPGLINGHTHAAMSFLRGKADDKPLMDWLTQDIFPIEAHLTEEMVKTATLFSTTEFLRTGTTTICDMYPFAQGVADALSLSGMRGLVGEGVLIYPTASFADGKEALEKAEILANRWKGHERVKVAVLPHAIYTTNAAFLEQCRDLASQYDLTLGMHLSETQFETQTCLETHGVRPVEYCRQLGLIHDKSVFFHAVDMIEEDLVIIQEKGASIVHNPTSNMKLASGVAPIEAMRALGIPLGLGTDGPASNNAQNMYREMHLSALLQKVFGLEATALPAQAALDMGTCGGAKALHWEGIGALNPGNAADFSVVDLSTPNMQPLYNIVSQLVYAASGMETVMTVVSGEILFEQGKYSRVDYDALCEEMESMRKWVLSLS